MKKPVIMSLIVLSAAGLLSCGMSREKRDRIIEEATDMRAKSFCTADTNIMGQPLEVYEFYLEALSAGLQDQGIEGDDYSAAVDLFDKKIRESCPEKYPK
jgi:hypothetical protein